MLLELLLIVAVLPALQAKDKIPYCPNGDTPKTDNSGVPIQCLPGQSAKAVCGKGYSCFFSGYNYQCCPQGEDEENEILDCPMNALTVLDAVGSPVRCDREKCPKDTMFCSKQGTTAICCESLLEASQESTPIKKDDRSELIDEECPSSALTVLNDDGNPLTCSSSKRCPQSTMKCMSVGKVSLCCEPLHSASSKEEDEFIKDLPQNSVRTPAQRNKAEVAFNPLKYVDSDVKLVKESVHKPKKGFVRGDGEMQTLHTSSAVAAGTSIQKSDLPTQNETQASRHTDEKPALVHEKTASNETIDAKSQKPVPTAAPHPVAKSRTSPPPTTTIVNVDIQEPETSTVDIDIDVTQSADVDVTKPTEKPRIQGLPTATENESEFEYKPHVSGGYALSERPQSVVRRPLEPNAKKIARKFLLDQIKRGWPYGEQFYRPNEDVEFVRSGSRSIAAVHFPS